MAASPEFFRRVIAVLEEAGIRYFITGSVASSSYGIARATNDMDVVVYLTHGGAIDLRAAFDDDRYYLSEHAIQDAMERCGQFNLIDSISGLKVDFIVAGDTEYEEERFERAVRRTVEPGFTAMFSSPEDVIIKKMQFYREGSSDKHLADIANILSSSTTVVDRAYVGHWAARFGVSDVWVEIQERLSRR